MIGLHIAVGCLVILLNLAAGVIGGWAWFKFRPSVPFWYLLRVRPGRRSSCRRCSAALLLVTDHSAKENLHYLYGILPLVISFIAEGARLGAAARELGELDIESFPAEAQESIALQIVRREMGIMAVSCIVIFFLAVRAATTSGI